jgi:hypothetical protein
MANSYDTTPNNFPKGESVKSVTQYLDLAGLTTFWGKAKSYIDDQDKALYAQVTSDIQAADSAMRKYVESLEVNGITVTTDAKEGQLGTELSVEITGKDITVGENGGDTYKNLKVDAAIAGVDTRLKAVETELNEGVVNQLTITATHDTTADDPAKEWLKVTTGAGPQTGNVSIDFDDTAIDQKFEDLDAEISDLIANAGVTNVKVVDVDNADGKTDYTGRSGLVEISLDGTKTGTVTGDASYERGDITITLDETELDTALDNIDTAIATEIADRKEDIALLAGTGYTPANGDTAGTWSESVKYTNIAEISERLADIDEDLVTKITEGTSTENFVTLAVGGADGSGDKEITITLDDSALKDYTDQNEGNWKALNDLKVNDKAIITVTTTVDAEGKESQVTVTKNSIVLDSSNINREGTTTTIEEALEEHDQKLRALVEATEFVGVVAWDPTAVTIGAGVNDNGVIDYPISGTNVPEGLKMQNGDIILTADGKEYILDANAIGGAKFVELGDTSNEVSRISALEDWVDKNYITAAEINALDWNAPASFK